MQPSYLFTDKEHRGPFEFSEELGSIAVGPDTSDNVIPAQGYEASDNDLLLSTSEKEESRVPLNNDSAYSAPDFNASSVPLVNIQGPSAAGFSDSGIDDLLGLGISVASPPPSLKLNPKAVLDPGTFQRKWAQLAISLSQVSFLELTTFSLGLRTNIFSTLGNN